MAGGRVLGDMAHTLASFFLLTKQPRNAFYARHVLSLKEASFYSSLFHPHPKKNYNFQLDMKIRREKRTAF